MAIMEDLVAFGGFNRQEGAVKTLKAASIPHVSE